MRVVKFLISGALGLATNIGLVALCVEKFNFHYLTASVIGFSAAVIIGFLLQKYWTFGEETGERIQTQFILYALLALFNLAMNTALVYSLVEFFEVYYLFAQALGALSVATVSFFSYREIIFKTKTIQ